MQIGPSRLRKSYSVQDMHIRFTSVCVCVCVCVCVRACVRVNYCPVCTGWFQDTVYYFNWRDKTQTESLHASAWVNKINVTEIQVNKLAAVFN